MIDDAQKVLIYGYGWVGQSMFRLCQDFRISFSVVDDGLDLSLSSCKSFVSFKEMLQYDFDLYLVSVADENVALKISQKLQDHRIEEYKIRLITVDFYKSKLFDYVLEVLGDGREIVKSLSNETIKAPEFHSKMQQAKKKYIEDKKINQQKEYEKYKFYREKIPDKTIIGRLYSTMLVKKGVSFDHVCYPGFSVSPSYCKQDDGDFWFVKRIDFDWLRNRPKDIKLIACFGNSALRVEYLPYSHTITHFLQEQLDNDKKNAFIVLNFGVTGYTVYEQLMLYTALVAPLKPEIVLSFFFGTDFRSGLICCDKLVKTHSMIYCGWWIEKDAKAVTGSEMPLLCEMNKLNITNDKICDSDINNAVIARLNQFHQIVCGGGGQFIAFVQPLLPSKLEWSKEEQRMRLKEKEEMKGYATYQIAMVDRFAEIIANFKKQCKDDKIDFVYDLNEVTRNSEESLFTHHWIHCNKRGNELVAHKVYEILNRLGILNNAD